MWPIFWQGIKLRHLSHTPISKNVVGENGEWQLSKGNCTTERNCGFHICKKKWVLRNHDGNKNPTDLHIWQWKTVFLHALHVHFSSFVILKTSSFFLWREMTFFAVVWTTWAYDDKCSILSCPKRWFRFNSRIVKPHFSGIMTLNNWKIAEMRSDIFRWRSRFRRRRRPNNEFPCEQGFRRSTTGWELLERLLEVTS